MALFFVPGECRRLLELSLFLVISGLGFIEALYLPFFGLFAAIQAFFGFLDFGALGGLFLRGCIAFVACGVIGRFCFLKRLYLFCFELGRFRRFADAMAFYTGIVFCIYRLQAAEIQSSVVFGFARVKVILLSPIALVDFGLLKFPSTGRFGGVSAKKKNSREGYHKNSNAKFACLHVASSFLQCVKENNGSTFLRELFKWALSLVLSVA